MRANWLCGRFCVQASSFENYIAEKPFTDRFVQQSPYDLLTDMDDIAKQENLMLAFESITNKFGKKKLAVGTCMFPDRKWTMCRNSLSQNYFSWDELLKINN